MNHRDVAQHASQLQPDARLVADELVAAALQTHTHNAEHQRSVNVSHPSTPPDAPSPATASGPVLLHSVTSVPTIKSESRAPERAGRDGGACPALHLIWCQVAFFDGKQCVRHCVLVSAYPWFKMNRRPSGTSVALSVLNHSRPLSTIDAKSPFWRIRK